MAGCPTPERQTCSALLRQGLRALLIDAGTGLTYLPREPRLLDGVTKLSLVLTHFHTDHTAGLSFAPGLGIEIPVDVHGPGALVYGTPTREMLVGTFRRPMCHADLDGLWPRVHDLIGWEQEINGFALRFRLHSGEVHGPTTHASGGQAGEIAREAGVERLTLIHVHPTMNPDPVLAEARDVFERSELGHDLAEFPC